MNVSEVVKFEITTQRLIRITVWWLIGSPNDGSVEPLLKGGKNLFSISKTKGKKKTNSAIKYELILKRLVVAKHSLKRYNSEHR